MDTDEWDVILQFVARIASFDVAGPSFVSLFEFASLVAYTQFQNWINLETGSADIQRSLEKNPYNTAGLTYTWDAVNRVLDEFYEYRQTCTDGCDTRKDLLFLITDGTPTDSVCPDMIARVNQSSVDIVIIGIGDDAETWMDAVACLDYRDDGDDIFYVTDIQNSDDFNAIEGMIRAKTCTGENPAGLSDRSGEPWVYEDGNIGLGPVPTASGENDAPKDDTPSPIEAAAGHFGREYYGAFKSPEAAAPSAQGWMDMIETHPTVFTLASLFVMGTVCVVCCMCAWFMHVYVGGAGYRPVKQVFVEDEVAPIAQF